MVSFALTFSCCFFFLCLFCLSQICKLVLNYSIIKIKPEEFRLFLYKYSFFLLITLFFFFNLYIYRILWGVFKFIKSHHIIVWVNINIIYFILFFYIYKLCLFVFKLWIKWKHNFCLQRMRWSEKTQFQ